MSSSDVLVERTGELIERRVRRLLQQETTMGPERRRSLAEHGIVKGAYGVAVALLLLVVAPHLQHHQLAGTVHKVRRIERPSLSLAAGGRLFEERFVPEETHPLFH